MSGMNPWSAPPLVDQGNAAITGGSITGTTGLPLTAAKSGIPIISMSTGSIGNNGALTGLTALPFVCANCYVVVPAGAIAAGVPAATAIYFAQMSSTTAGTIFNNLLSANLSAAGEPLIPASPTAFATTGPGAFTGSTALDQILSLNIPALQKNSLVRLYSGYSITNNANTKTAIWKFGGSGSAYFNANLVSMASLADFIGIQNRGATNSQVSFVSAGGASSIVGFGQSTNNQITGSTETNAGTTIVLSFQKATATDNMVIETFNLEYVL